MKKPLLLALLALVPAAAMGAPPSQSTPPSHTVQSAGGVFMGIGASIRDGDPSIYLPIEISPAFRVEPFFAWSEVDTGAGGSTESRQAGAGGFFRFDLHEQLQTYAGGRLAFVEMEDPAQELDGFRIEPTVGVEFWATRRFTLALEAFLYLEDLDGSTAGGLAVERESTGTDTRLLVRFFP